MPGNEQVKNADSRLSLNYTTPVFFNAGQGLKKHKRVEPKQTSIFITAEGSVGDNMEETVDVRLNVKQCEENND